MISSRSHFWKLKLAIHGCDLVSVPQNCIDTDKTQVLDQLCEVTWTTRWPRSDPDAYDRYDSSHGRSVPDAGTIAIPHDRDPSAIELKVTHRHSLHGFHRSYN